MTGIKKETTRVISKYLGSDDKTISVSVFESTGINEEQLFHIHEVEHEEGTLDWQLSNSIDPLI